MADRDRDLKEIAKVVRETLADDFDNITIFEVRVSSEEDSDDDLLRIEVIFEGTPKDKDLRTIRGAVRQVRPELQRRLGEKHFLYSPSSPRRR